MAMIGKVLRMHHREKKSVREIVRATSLARNTVRKYLRTDKAEPPQYRRRPTATKLGPFVEAVRMALLADARRPRKERRSAKALLKQIAEAGYEGGYTQLTGFIRAWRAQQGGVAVGKAFVPLAFELGEAFQFSWSEEGLVAGGIYYRLQVSHMKLCFSRAFWLVAYPSQRHEMLFDAHRRRLLLALSPDRVAKNHVGLDRAQRCHKPGPVTPLVSQGKALPKACRGHKDLWTTIRAWHLSQGHGSDQDGTRCTAQHGILGRASGQSVFDATPRRQAHRASQALS